METRANFAIITIFVLAVIGSAFLFVMWFTHTETGPKQRTLTVAFEDPVSGLVRGSDVDFNGIRVGDVRRVYMDPNVPSRAYAEISIDSDTPVRTDTRASLSTSTLSGTAALTLQGGAATAPELVPAPNGTAPVLFAQTSGLAGLMEAAQNVGTKAETLRTQLGEVLAENRDSIGAITRNIEPVIGLVNGDSPNTRRAAAAMSEAATRFGPVGTKLSATSDRLSALWQAVNPTRVAAIRENASGLIDTIQANRPQIDAIADNARGLGAKVGEITPKLDRTTGRGEAVMGAIDQTKLAHAMDNIDVMRGAFDASRGDLDAAQQNLASIQDKMDRLSDRFARVRQQAADFIGSDGTTNAFSAVGRAAASIRRTSNNLSGYVQTISTSITRFRGASTREISTLGSDAKRALDDAKRAGNHISNNPSSVIFGGSSQTLPTYNGR